MPLIRWLARLFFGRSWRCYYCGRPSRGTCPTCAREIQEVGM